MIIAICLIVSYLIIGAMPTGAMTTTTSLAAPPTVYAGDTVKFGFSMAGSSLHGVTGMLSYDTNQLTLVEIVQEVASPWVVECHENYFIAYDNAMSTPIDDEVKLFSAIFKVKNVASGTTIQVSCQDVTASDGDSDSVIGSVSCSTTVVAGSATEQPSTPDNCYRLDVQNVTGLSYDMPLNWFVEKGATVTLPSVDPTENGKLGYWSLREDGKYRRYNPGESYTVKSDTTFYFVTPTVDLTINAQTQGNVAQNFIYQITATDFSMEVCATAGTPLTVCDLPADKTYTVTEMTGYSWRYTTATAAAGGATGTTSIVVDVANASGGVIDVTFSHSNRNDKWLTDTKSETTQYVPYRMVKCTITDFGENSRINGTTPVKENLEVYNSSSGTDYIYVRMVVTPYYVDGEGNIANRAPWTLPSVRDGWVKYNGFYYYTKPLAPNNAESVAARTYTTGRLFATDLTFGENQAWSYSAQAIEATADAAKELWGVVISPGSVNDAND